MDSPSNLSVDYLNLLPDEILVEVLLKTDDLETLSKWCQTSKRVNDICQDKFFWHRKYQRDFGEITLFEGETWKELYKRRILSGMYHPISAGREVYGIIDQKGDLYMSGPTGLLGIGQKKNTISRVLHLVKFSSKVVSISVAGLVAGAVTKDGKAYIWGANNDGLFGFQDKLVRLPREITLPTKAIKIEVSRMGYIILLEDSSVYLSKVGSILTRIISFQGLLDVKAVDVSIGWRIYSIITKSNKVLLGGYIFLWGSKTKYNDKLVPLIFTKPVKSFIAARQATMILTTAGEVYIIHNIRKLVTIPENIRPRLIQPLELIKLPELIVQISASSGTFAALSESGKLYMWGSNAYNRISKENQSFTITGRRKIETALEPVEISFGLPINYVSVGTTFTIAVSNDGVVNYWGDSKFQPE